jgi:ABC-type Fe3+-siderophore transport system permease subunit
MLPTTIPAELYTIIPIVLIISVLGVLFAARTEPDARGHRPYARGLMALGLLTLFVSLYAGFIAVSSLTDLVVNHRDRARATNQEFLPEDLLFGNVQLDPGGGYPIMFPISDFSFDRTNNSNYDGAVAGGLSSMTAGGLCFALRKRRRRLEQAAPNDPTVVRTTRAHRSGVAALAGVTLAVSVATMGYAIWELAAPGIAGAGFPADVIRMEGVAEFLAFGVLAAASALLLRGALRDLGPLTPAPRSTTRSTAKKTTARKPRR